VQHHEVGTAGQAEIDMRFDTLTKMGDKMMVFKYVIKNVAAQHGYVATFMPKPLFQDNGSGMHIHFSLWKGDKPLFAGNRYAGQTRCHGDAGSETSNVCRQASGWFWLYMFSARLLV